MIVKMELTPKIHGWLVELAETGLYGRNIEEVIDHLVRAGIRRELNPDGLLMGVLKIPGGK